MTDKSRPIFQKPPAARLKYHEANLDEFRRSGVDVSLYERGIGDAWHFMEKKAKAKLLLTLARLDAERVRLFWITDPALKTGEQIHLGGKAGGVATSRNHEARRREVIYEMDRLITGKGMSISSAAAHAAKNGIGTSKGANLKLWQRQASKILHQE